jgi:hypothetical protein
MQEMVFRDYLTSRGIPEVTINAQVAFIQQLEAALQKKVPSWTLDDLNGGSAQSIIDDLIDRGENSLNNLQAIAQYAWSAKNQPLFNAISCMLDGHEAMDQLFERLSAFAGEDLRDIIFEDLPLPPLGVSAQEKARYTFRLINRMEMIFEESTTREILKDSLHILPDAMYEPDKQLFLKKCNRDIDQFLLEKGKRFIKSLESQHNREDFYYWQEIDEEVIAFVRSNPQIGQGVRQGNIIFETIIPYDTKAYLVETDPDKRRYHYCHCPWVRESLRKKTFKVSATFCQCSAGFHKKRYEVIFEQPVQARVLQSVLNGDPICQLAIQIPDGLMAQ